MGLGDLVHLDPEPDLPALPSLLYVVIHPVNTAAHPTLAPGWRWAVMLGPCPPSSSEHTANAGWCPNEQEARAEGEQNGNSALAALLMFGMSVRPAPQVLVLDHDPIPAGHDPVRVL